MSKWSLNRGGVVTTLLGLVVSHLQQALVIGAFLLVWLVSSAFISASLDTIGHTRFARDKGLDILFLRIANVSMLIPKCVLVSMSL